MLHDFISLEDFYGRVRASFFMEELLAQYDARMITDALNDGYIEARKLYIGPNSGRDIFCLTDKGRQMANGEKS